MELLPEDAHPLDVRYNVIQWVHRRTRGWSYGGGVIDPRTGEFVAVDESLFLEAGLSRRFARGTAGLPPFRLSVGVENLTDEAIFDQLGLPRPGRTVTFEMDLF